MNNTARERIFARLHQAVRQGASPVPEPEPLTIPQWDQKEKTEKLKQHMEAVRTEVHVVSSANWTDTLKEILRKRNLSTLLYAPDTAVGKAVQSAWNTDKEGLPSLCLYEGEIEGFKEKLFGTDAAITSTIGGIAETGALILWPDEKEPRLMSLIPPVHIAVLEAGKIYNTFSEAMEKGGWTKGMPTNALLISGPSKTADIELVLAFGVHGPKELIVLVLA
ncbi:MAG: lactate utilization protein C [Desulfococcaceae bacterium]